MFHFMRNLRDFKHDAVLRTHVAKVKVLLTGTGEVRCSICDQAVCLEKVPIRHRCHPVKMAEEIMRSQNLVDDQGNCKLCTLSVQKEHSCSCSLVAQWIICPLSTLEAALAALKDCTTRTCENALGMYVNIVEQGFGPSGSRSVTQVLIAPVLWLGVDHVGLHACEEVIHKDQVICWYVGRSVMEQGGESVENSVENKEYGCSIQHYGDLHKKKGVREVRVDPTISGNQAHRANQACGQLCNSSMVHPTSSNRLNPKDESTMKSAIVWSSLVASRDISFLEEICWNYEMGTDVENEEQFCLCLECVKPGSKPGYLCRYNHQNKKAKLKP